MHKLGAVVLIRELSRLPGGILSWLLIPKWYAVTREAVLADENTII